MIFPTAPKPSPTQPKLSKRLRALSACVALGTAIALGLGHQHDPSFLNGALSQVPLVRDFFAVAPAKRPYGMAPQAFAAYLRACKTANIDPFRIGQTIGDDPRSVGYHRRDGVLKIGGENIEYCAAVDLAVFGLNGPQITQFQNALAQEGFASFYRHEGKWAGDEHIHAIYGRLKMKPQLAGQTRDWLRTRHKQNLPHLPWENQFRALN